ncbi:type VI secretion system Vgr family protein [Collimonas humicola]|uniref:type VI secretion system Vgr family protein n=1 Tax=Collimonas humicola TaxID=2825886 RepID=UPI001B8B2437|nr:type VI secretion system Vgr family protein [Collimonas humicola]
MFDSTRSLRVKCEAIPEVMGIPALVPMSIKGYESLNSLFHYKIILKTPDALVDFGSAANYVLKDFERKELTVEIQLEGAGSFVSGMSGSSGFSNVGAGTREISGIITQATMLRQVGRYVFYEFTLEPWLRLANNNADCRIFQDKTVVEILDEVLSKYTFSVDKRLYGQYPKRDYTTQYSESDFTFFSRLCETWGINYFFEHKDGKHRLVLTDANAAHKPFDSEAYHVLNYYGEKPRIDQEYIHTFSPSHRLTPGRYTSRDYDYTRPRSTLEVTESDPRVSDHNAEVYEYHADAHYVQPQAGPQRATNDPLDEGQKNARIRMDRLLNNAQRTHGAGHLRAVVPGCTFKLGRHPSVKANIDYLIIGTRFEMEDVAQESQRPGGGSQQFRINVDFDVVPLRGEQYRPENVTPKPVMHILTAIVTGPENAPNWTDDFGRIKVQFQWDRLSQGDQNSSCWVRVSSPWAGNQLGGIHIPRPNQEVLIDFISGNPDLPICTGRVHNAANMPPWTLPSQNALSGFRSRELTPGGGNSAAGRSNYLVMDDTEAKIQAQFGSSHQHSQISLGHITRIEDNAGRKDDRGEGLEARTDGAAVVRAAKGLLLTTDGRAAAVGGILSRDELVACLEQALNYAKGLGQSAATHEGGERHIEPQQHLTEVIDALGHGFGNEVNVKGKAPAGQPVIALSSPAGIASATPKNQTHFAGQNIDTVAGQNQQHYAMDDMLHTAGKNIEHFAVDGDIRQIANKGKIIHQAQHNAMELTADKTLTVTSVSDGIEVRAEKFIMMQVGSSFIRMEESQITIDAKIVKIQSDAPSFTGAHGASVAMPKFTLTKLNQELKAHHDSDKSNRATKRKFKITENDASVAKNTSATDGLIPPK